MARPLARGQPTAAKAPLQGGGPLRPGPLQGATARGHDRLQPGPLQGAITHRGNSPHAGGRLRARRQQEGRPLPAASPQGAACPWQGHRGSACPRPARRGAVPTEAPPASTAPAVGAVAGGQG
ncbi:hypothetical protein BHM03_00056039 [Ensete ventricosum]|nr:hypothetical protein BHM03_00056039 [Ensete ventricosum]